MPCEDWTLDDVPVGVWIGHAPDGRVAYANRAFNEILGMSAVADSRTEDVPATYHVIKWNSPGMLKKKTP